MIVYKVESVTDTTLTLSQTTPSPSPATELSIPLSSIAFLIAPSNDNQTLVYLTTPEESTVPRLQSVALAAPLPSSLSHLKLPPHANSKARRLHIISNDTAGAGKASEVVEHLITPLLKLAGVEYKIWKTKGVNDAARIGKDILAEAEGGEKVTIAVVGGDGTVHELLNGILDENGSGGGREVDLVLLPYGTGNALYYHSFPPESSQYPSSFPLSTLYSLLAFLRPSATASPKPLSLAINSLPAKPNVISSVVTSSALHAAILHDAEALRKSHPGVERFKIAAVKNATIWTEGSLTLSGKVSRYDLKTKSFLPEKEQEKTLEGPFLYLTSALVSRFESNFVLAPHRSPLSPLSPSLDLPSIDLVLIRPSRSLSASEDVTQKTSEEFVGKLWKVTGGMYAGGTHVDETYDGTETEVVEYYRCSSFTWKPTLSEENPNVGLICLDGALERLKDGEELKTTAIGGEKSGVRIWA